MRNDLKVPAEKLRKVVNPADFTSAVEPAEGFIGHERAVRAIDIGLEIDSPEHNIYVAGSTGISRKSVLIEHIEKYARNTAAASGFTLRDFCYVHNFEKPDEPNILIFKSGEGRKFRALIEVALLRRLRKEVPEVFKSDEYSRTRDDTMRAVDEKSDKLRKHLDEELKREGFWLFSIPPTGLILSPISVVLKSEQPQPMSPEEYGAMDAEVRSELDKIRVKLSKNVEKVFQQIYRLQREAQQKIEKLEQNLVKNVLESELSFCMRRYSGYPEVISFLRGLRDYVLNNINLFRENGAADPMGHMMGLMGQNGQAVDPFLPFRINILLDNSRTKQIPVVFESNPTFQNLFGKMEKKFVQGGYITDHTFLRAGSLLAADGGYLVLNAIDVLSQENTAVWRKLENTLRYGFLELEDPMSRIGFMPATLNPKPIPVRLKVILVGDVSIYQLLAEHDNNFLANFKVKAELDSEMPATPENVTAYARFVAKCCKEKSDRRENNLLPFDSSAVAKIVEHGHRLADSQAKLSLKFDVVKDLVTESNHFAARAGSVRVGAEHVQMALESQRLRASLAESKLQELIKDEILLITTTGREVGQVNALVVLSTGDYSFGVPSRVTATTFLGKKGVASIDREVNMSGPIHNKGVHILSSYFGGKYGQENVISFSATLCFGQLYHGIEGDSASFAELASLTSSFSKLPIDQSFSVTGSVNEKGEIQPIGGVNQKIEGFFNICRQRGLTGDHGVIIPHQNVVNLMLREDIVDACREGKFHVFAIKTVDEGLELLLGEPAETVHRKVEARLAKMTKKIQRASKGSEE